MTKYNLPDTVSGGIPNVNNLTAEATYYQTLVNSLTRTETGVATYTSSSSGVSHSTNDYSGDADVYNKGGTGLKNLLAKYVLPNYILTATDWNQIGDLSTLTTTEKTNLVGAINEVDTDLTTHLAEYTTFKNNNTSSHQVFIRDILRMKLRQTGLNLDPNAWSDTLEDDTGINAGASSNYNLTGGKLTLLSDPNTKLLLHMNGSDGSTTFTDEIGKTVTANGSSQIDTAQSKFGGASGLFSGSSNYLSLADNEDFEFGSGDFTIDFWMRPTSIPGTVNVLRKVGSSFDSILLYLESSNSKLYLCLSSNGSSYDIANSVASTTVFSIDTWYHLALVRNGTSVKLYVNGVADISVTSSAALHNNTGELRLGSITGNIDEFRLVKGEAKWTTDFTPSTTEYSITEGTAIVVWNAQTSEGTILNAIVEAVENLNAGVINYYVSRDNGANFTECTLDTVIDITAQPTGTNVVLKITITEDAELLAVAWGGEI